MTSGHSANGRACLAGIALLVYAAVVPAQTQEERALGAVREELAALQERLDRDHADRERRYRALRAVELDLAEAAARLERLRTQRQEQEARGAELADRTSRASARLAEERGALASQLRMSFMTGRQETLKLMLNQESPEQLGRMIIYYDYLNRARSRRIENVSGELATLAELADASARLALELGATEREQQRALDGLERMRMQRRTAVAELEAAIESTEEEIARLRAEEARLTELMREIRDVLSEFPVDSQEPFSASRGNLAWPVAGEVLARFGAPRAGSQIRWRGVQVAALAGTPVRSIYHGRVVYSDWLPGHGLLIIVDHGEGYMSLYGHNEALLKESGDWVAPGEAIAQVGDSGGQARTALYFEIREAGEPVDPQPWMRRSAPQR